MIGTVWECYQGKREIDQAYVRELFDYQDGELYWRHRPVSHFKNYHSWRRFRLRFPGTPAGTLPSVERPKKHRRVSIDGDNHYLARVIWLHRHGEWPAYCWHLDGNRQNCAIENLEALNRGEHLRRLEETSRYLAIQRGLL